MVDWALLIIKDLLSIWIIVNGYLYALVSSARARPSYVRPPQQAKEQNGQSEQAQQEARKSVLAAGKVAFLSNSHHKDDSDINQFS